MFDLVKIRILEFYQYEVEQEHFSICFRGFYTKTVRVTFFWDEAQLSGFMTVLRFI